MNTEELQARKAVIQARMAILRKKFADVNDKDQRHTINVEIDALSRELKEVKEGLACLRSIDRELGTLGVGD